MVQLTRIYTKGGDKGKTSLGDGTRVPKTDPTIDAIGAVDELNAHVGLAAFYLEANPEHCLALRRIQHDLFDLGADLCIPQKETTDGAHCLRVSPHQVTRLEKELDALNGALSPLTSFVLPGGSLASAQLHVARTVARRAERALCHLEQVNDHGLCYINRLSDYLFVLARYVNQAGQGDVLWQPGLNQEKGTGEKKCG